MGLFDAIERMAIGNERTDGAKSQAQCPPVPESLGTIDLGILAHCHHQIIARDEEPEAWRPSSAERAERHRILGRKPEYLSFLSPCTVCNGRAFLHIDGGGFVCQICHPGLFGRPVEATGPVQPSQDKEVDLCLAGEHLYLATTIQKLSEEPTEQQRSHFTAAWPWIKENKPALLAMGWTMAALVARSKYRWPCGAWGVAWLPAWSKPGVAVSIVQKGSIIFRYESNGRMVEQTIKPISRVKHKKTIT